MTSDPLGLNFRHPNAGEGQDELFFRRLRVVVDGRLKPRRWGRSSMPSSMGTIFSCIAASRLFVLGIMTSTASLIILPGPYSWTGGLDPRKDILACTPDLLPRHLQVVSLPEGPCFRHAVLWKNRSRGTSVRSAASVTNIIVPPSHGARKGFSPAFGILPVTPQLA